MSLLFVSPPRVRGRRGFHNKAAPHRGGHQDAANDVLSRVCQHRHGVHVQSCDVRRSERGNTDWKQPVIPDRKGKASCVVAGTNGAKRSVKLELNDHGRRVGVGSVTIAANQEIPAAGSIIKVKFLYAHTGGSLYQPVCLGKRDGIAVAACTVGQLKLKAGEEDAER